MTEKKGNARLECANIIENLSGTIPNLIHLTTDGSDYTNIKYGKHFDVGVAEQNLINISIGLGLRGHKVILNGISSFILGNAYLQLKNLCYHNVDVTILGIGSGLSYSKLGYSHQTPYDLSLLSTLPNMKILIPSDSLEAKKAIEYAVSLNGPTFVRIRTGFEPLNYEEREIFFDKPNFYFKENSENLIIANGATLYICIDIAKKEKFDLINLNSLNVFSIKNLVEQILSYKNIYIVEENYDNLGFGSQLLFECNRRKNFTPKRKIHGIEKKFVDYCGDHDYMFKTNKLDSENIKRFIEN